MRRRAQGIGSQASAIASLMREIELRAGKQGGRKAALRVAEAHHLPDDAGAVVWDAAIVLLHYLDGAPAAGFGT